MIRNRHTVIACVLVLLFGSVLFYVGTDSFTAYTAETARVNQLLEDQPKFPEVLLEDSKGKQYSITEFEGKYVFITFMYTLCATVCIQLEHNMSKVYEKVPEKYKGKDIVFLSISFDPTRDTPAVLDEYKNYFGSDGETWRMARVPNQEELDNLLESLGVIVIPDGKGNFAHNSAFYLIDRTGHLTEVMDFTNVDAAAIKVNDLLKRGD